MNTFFDKLTEGALPQSPNAELAASRAPSRSPMRRMSAPSGKSMPIRVEGEERGREEEAPMEEEGELTIDIFNRGDEIVIQSTVAGVKPEDLDVSITNDSVTIRGRREQQEEVAEENYYYKELFWGTFSRQVILPEEIEEDEAEATLKNGLLTLRLPKKRRGVVQKVKVRVT